MGFARTRRLDLALFAPPLVVALLSSFALSRRGARIAWHPLLVLAALAVVFVALMAIYERRDRRLADVVRAAAAGVLMSNVFALPMYALASLHRPLVDRSLAAADLAIGVDVSGLASRVQHGAFLAKLSSLTYETLLPFSLLALILPVLRNRADRAWRVLLAISFASALSLALFALFPAVGPWTVFEGITPSLSQIETTRAFEALRGGAAFSVDLANPAPLVAMPSWHALLAVLSARALAWSRAWRWLPALWGVAISLSAITTGWHYAVDVLAGAALAEVAWQLAGPCVPFVLPAEARTAAVG